MRRIPEFIFLPIIGLFNVIRCSDTGKLWNFKNQLCENFTTNLTSLSIYIGKKMNLFKGTHQITFSSRLLGTRWSWETVSSNRSWLTSKTQAKVQTDHLMIFLIGFHFLQGWKATKRDGVTTKKKKKKRMEWIRESYLESGQRKVSINSRLKVVLIKSQRKAFCRQSLQESSCARKETVDIDIK